MNVKYLTIGAVVVGLIAALSLISAFVYPASQMAFSIERFQTLVTGVVAGLSALI